MHCLIVCVGTPPFLRLLLRSTAPPLDNVASAIAPSVIVNPWTILSQEAHPEITILSSPHPQHSSTMVGEPKVTASLCRLCIPNSIPPSAQLNPARLLRHYHFIQGLMCSHLPSTTRLPCPFTESQVLRPPHSGIFALLFILCLTQVAP